jgi:hypothetical protein
MAGFSHIPNPMQLLISTYRQLIPAILLLAIVISCLQEENTQNNLTFEKHTISENADMWWARAVADISGNRLPDVALQDNNAHGGWLGWFESQHNGTECNLHIIAETAPDGRLFAGGDLAAGDINNDGYADIIGLAHPGEWENECAETFLL